MVERAGLSPSTVKHVTERLRAFETEQIRQRVPDYAQNRRVFEALYREALALGVFPAEDPLDGIDVDLRLARIVNVRTAPR